MEQLMAALIQIATADPDAFDTQNMKEQGVIKYMCDAPDYSKKLIETCRKINELNKRNLK